MKAWRAANPDKVAASRVKDLPGKRRRDRARYVANPGPKKETARAYRLLNPEKVRATKRRYAGILDAPGDRREGMCPICTLDGPLVCDHWHAGSKKGRVRGWVCDNCNRGLGCLKDSPENLDRAKAYLLADPPK